MKQILQFSILLAGTLLITPPAFADQIGVIGGTKHSVSIERGGKVIKAKSGGALHEGDKIRTAANQPVQLILMDETVFTLGGDSHFSLDQFNYDAAKQDGSLQVRHHTGTLKFSSGHISDGNPENFKIMLPGDSQIGVRGTVGTITVLPPQQTQSIFPDHSNSSPSTPDPSWSPPIITTTEQPIIFAALHGPGPSTNANVGSFNFSTPNGDVDLSDKDGYFYVPDAGTPPTPFLAPPEATNQITNSLTNDGDDEGSDDGNQNTSDTASQGSGGLGGSTDFTNTSPPNNDITNLLLSANNNVDPSDLGTDTRPFGGTLQELVAVNSGSVDGSGTYTGTITGDFDFLIDFANRTFDLQSYNLNGGGLTNDSIDVQGGSAALPSDMRTSITVGSGPDDIPATITPGCDNCLVTATFPTANSISATITNEGPSGTTGEIGF